MFPTALIHKNPLVCTVCIDGLKGCNGSKVVKDDPKYDFKWTNRHCKLDPKAVDQFLLYFPYILLIVSLLLFFIERIFKTFSNSKKEYETIYKAVGEESFFESRIDYDLCDNEIMTKPFEVEKMKFLILEGARTQNNFYELYLTKTISKLSISLAFFLWLMIYGYQVLMIENENRSPGFGILGTKAILCEIEDIWYFCTGIPFQFYVFVFHAGKWSIFKIDNLFRCLACFSILILLEKGEGVNN